MRENWVSDKFSNCFKLKSGDNLTKKNMQEGPYPVYGGNGIAGHHSEFNLDGQNLLIGRVGALCGNARFVNEKVWLTDNAFRIEDTYYDFDYRFLEYLLNYLNLKSYARQTAQPVISNSSLKNVKIEFPESLPEQKRIVTILDEAFEAIDQARANIERNIENAEELFQSKLNEIFSQRGEGWISEKLSDVFKMKSGDQLSKKNVIPGPYPVYGGNGITAHHKEYNLDGQQIVIGRVGAQCGNVHLTDEKIWLTDNAFKLTDLKFEFDFEFLEHLLRVKDLRQTARQTAQPVISNSSCKNVQLDFPESISQQKEIAELVNVLDSEVLQIIEAYKTKLLALAELKKSILQKAFSDELTVNEHVAA